MKLYIRLIRTLLVALMRPRLGILDESVTGFRVWPNDLDLNILVGMGRFDLLFDVGGVHGIELDGDLTRNVVDPGVRRLIDHVDAAGREAGEESHDGEHDCQRVADDRRRRHDLRARDLEARGQQRGEPGGQNAGKQARPGIVLNVGDQAHVPLTFNWPSSSMRRGASSCSIRE